MFGYTLIEIYVFIGLTHFTVGMVNMVLVFLDTWTFVPKRQRNRAKAAMDKIREEIDDVSNMVGAPIASFLLAVVLLIISSLRSALWFYFIPRNIYRRVTDKK